MSARSFRQVISHRRSSPAHQFWSIALVSSVLLADVGQLLCFSEDRLLPARNDRDRRRIVARIGVFAIVEDRGDWKNSF